MVRTRVGYTGGTTPSPTYRDLGDHTEAIEVDYDPALIGYTDLVQLFVESHDPCASAWSTQYRSAVWVRSDEEEAVVRAALEAAAAARRGTVRTAIERMGVFHRAEDYHQKYRLRNTPDVFRSLQALYPREPAFTDATATARVNAHLCGSLSLEDLRSMLAAEGLEAVGKDRLEAVRRAP